MSTLPAIAIRLELTTRSVPPVPPTDANTGELPAAWRGADLDFEIGIFDPAGFSVDLSNLAYLEVDIFPFPIPALRTNTNQTYAPYSMRPFPTVPPAPLLRYTIPASAITPTITRAGWALGIEQQVTAHFGWRDTLALNLGGQPSAQFGISIHGITKGADFDPVDFDPEDFSIGARRKITYGGGAILFFETGEQGIYLPNRLAPAIIPLDTILLIESNEQMTFALPISVDGDLILDGYLIELGASPSSGDFDPADFNPADFDT